MPTILGTLGLVCLRIIISIIIALIFSIIILMIFSIFYKKINRHEMEDFQENNYFSRIRYVSYLFLFIIITISFISPQGSEYSYRNRLDFIDVTEQDQLYHKPGAIHKFFNPEAKTVISSSQLNKIKDYHLVPRNHQYEGQRQSIIKKAQYRLRNEKKYYTSDY